MSIPPKKSILKNKETQETYKAFINVLTNTHYGKEEINEIFKKKFSHISINPLLKGNVLSEIHNLFRYVDTHFIIENNNITNKVIWNTLYEFPFNNFIMYSLSINCRDSETNIMKKFGALRKEPLYVTICFMLFKIIEDNYEMFQSKTLLKIIKNVVFMVINGVKPSLTTDQLLEKNIIEQSTHLAEYEKKEKDLDKIKNADLDDFVISEFILHMWFLNESIDFKICVINEIIFMIKNCRVAGNINYNTFFPLSLLTFYQQLFSTWWPASIIEVKREELLYTPLFFYVFSLILRFYDKIVLSEDYCLLFYSICHKYEQRGESDKYYLKLEGDSSYDAWKLKLKK